ncbi:hypothetical protein [Sporomusa acidovorans]|uniref:Uncharacterized protein n=1 Tax=Sporomusa acidovorans (strain ATCC 49682 / DSM 3132 / Mol) TaxID=1123286 RepID=A0ABZ3J262_SPOA4|nr:hypothetical protein [Sporomusa acidovorans]OZC24175.1 hypothetical protein SPACI_02110 [Sporomusa acidovorans DSM 3132]SDF37991.1 small multidrug resistance pump/multidrug resistance protein EbrA [Sporomusa acidovorans]
MDRRAFIKGIGAGFITLLLSGCGFALHNETGAATALIGVVIWKEQFNLCSGLGLLLIVVGVVLLNFKGNVH